MGQLLKVKDNLDGSILVVYADNKTACVKYITQHRFEIDKATPDDVVEYNNSGKKIVVVKSEDTENAAKAEYMATLSAPTAVAAAAPLLKPDTATHFPLPNGSILANIIPDSDTASTDIPFAEDEPATQQHL